MIAFLQDLGYRCYWHPTPYYNADNFFGNDENVFDAAGSCSMFCLPRETQENISGMPEVSGVDDWVLKA